MQTKPDWHVVLSDFGMARALPTQGAEYYRQVSEAKLWRWRWRARLSSAALAPHPWGPLEQGSVDAQPFRWMALETLHTSRFTKASDVYALGVFLWELFSGGERPWGDMGVMNIAKALSNGRHLLLDPTWPEDLQR
jgi:serine/threonine protein kinase